MLKYYFDLALRSVRRTPYISALMITAIAAGVGMTVTMLSVFMQLSHNPAENFEVQPYAFQLQSNPAGDGWLYGDAYRQITYQDAEALRRGGNDGYTVVMYKTHLAARSTNPELDPQSVSARVTTRDFFSLFNLNLVSGNIWSNDVDENGDMVAVITERLAQALYPNMDAVGQVLLLNESTYQVIGVVENFAPQPKYYDLNNSTYDRGEDLFVPFSLTPIEEFNSSGNNNGWKTERIDTYEDYLNSELHWIQAWKGFETTSQRESFERWVAGYIDEQQQAGRFPNPEASFFLRDTEEWLTLLGVVVAEARILVVISVLFLIVCLINTVGLLLGKFLKNAPAVGTRRALGASQSQIFLQHIIEVSLIGIVGGLLGLMFAMGILSAIDVYLNRGMGVDGLMITKLHWTMWLWAPFIAIVSSILAGLIPAWRICRMPPSLYLKIQ